MLEFREWRKIPRLNKDMTITEKIDGTNAAVVIARLPMGTAAGGAPSAVSVILDDSEIHEDGLPMYEWWVGAQSRKRLLSPGDDNFGFAAWVQANAGELVALLGEGHHFGEWWGRGIQRGYGMNERVFSLFDWHRHGVTLAANPALPELDVVPVLYQGPFDTTKINQCVEGLRLSGSMLGVPGHRAAEGVVVYHHAANMSFKVLLEGDDVPKSTRQEYTLAA